MKALAGDDEPQVLGEVFASLLAIERSDAVDFVAEFLHSRAEHIVESALLALGESRLPEAFETLRTSTDDYVGTSLQSTFFTAIALTRQPDAIELLLEHLRAGSIESAAQALRAAAIYRGDARVSAEVKQVVAQRNDPTLLRAYQNDWPPTP